MDASRPRATNIRDVARLAGVSYQTVSRVLNDSPSIRATTKQRVLDVIAETGFVPNAAARVLVTSRSRTIGVLSQQGTFYGPATSVTAIEHAARAAGYRLSITTVEGDRESIRVGVDQLMSQSVEAIVVIAPQRRTFDVLDQTSIGVPFVTLQGTDFGAHSMSVDQAAGARLATQHLIDCGHRDIVHLAGPADWIEAEARARGFAEQLAVAGLTSRPPIVGDWTAESGYRAGRELLRERDFTAVFASNDQMALGFMHACREAGVDVPSAISVVGFDDIPEAAHFSPPLTTVRQNFDELGERAVAILLAELKGIEDHSPESLVPELVVRETTAVVTA
jgi:DNA-binding LacI/PurR family transcriptional regulator